MNDWSKKLCKKHDCWHHWLEECPGCEGERVGKKIAEKFGDSEGAQRRAASTCGVVEGSTPSLTITAVQKQNGKQHD